MNRRWFAWWGIAEEVAARLTQPRVDRAAADADVHAVVTASRLFAWAGTVSAAVERAWIHSRVRRGVDDIRRQVAVDSLAVWIRFLARCTLAAAVTSLLLLAAGTATGRRFQTLLPIAVGVVALAAARFAESIAQARRGKQA
jgi:hypothetical protein